MRPVRIELQGFSAFREPTVIDLTDTELFALVGPTGAGKSSVIDAMVFALYGAVPRYGSENLVHPVITQGAVEARVRLDFLVGGVVHTATRVVRRTKTGASTKEARLERQVAPDEPTEVLADDAKALTTAVVGLLGLDLEQFTKCVVLPQGAFATLLHDTKAKRQDLLVKLLDLGVYERVATAARAEVKRIGFRLESLDEQLAHAAGATTEAVADVAAHVVAVDGIVRSLDQATPVLAARADELARIDRDLDDHRRMLSLLDGVSIPTDIADLADQALRARAAADAAAASETEQADRVTQAVKGRDALPDPADLVRVRDDHIRLAELEAAVAKGAELVTALEEAGRERAATFEVAEGEHAEAVAARDRVRIAHAAADLGRHLHVGDDCPVCGNEVAELPLVDVAAVESADAAVDAAEARVRQARTELAERAAKLADYRARLDVRTTERDAVLERLRDVRPVAEIEADLASIAAADAEVAAARSADTVARRDAAQARAAVEAAAAQMAAARTGFMATRDRLAALEPPVTTDDLAADWSALAGWAAQQTDEVRRRADAASQRRTQLAAEQAASHEQLIEQAAAAGLVVRSFEGLRDACVAEAASARVRHDRLVADLARADGLRSERDQFIERRQVHDLLADSLGARGFEAWLLDEALAVLLDGASTWLEQLSSGRYAMAVDDKNQFAVVDHANADELRLARTLSGGETFLASLALALALAERVSELSAVGGTTLDAIFLDEGFGTLDPDTLDVVATAIEELGATGRMVGVISHVRELAERVPVRFEISKVPGTSTVRRVET